MPESQRRAPKGLRRLTIFPLTKDEDSGLTYGAAMDMQKAVMTATHTPSNVSGQLEADDGVVENEVQATGGTLAIGVTALTAGEAAAIYGHKLENGTNVSNRDDIAGDVGVAYMTERPDGKFNLFKFFKVKFSPQAMTHNTKKVGSIEYATTNLSGNYVPTYFNGNDMAYRYGVDPVADSAIINEWFTDGAYKAPDAGGAG